MECSKSGILLHFSSMTKWPTSEPASTPFTNWSWSTVHSSHGTLREIVLMDIDGDCITETQWRMHNPKPIDRDDPAKFTYDASGEMVFANQGDEPQPDVTIYTMGLHEELSIDENISVLRVPNGWIYHTVLDVNGRVHSFNSVFVRYSTEFKT